MQKKESHMLTTFVLAFLLAIEVSFTLSFVFNLVLCFLFVLILIWNRKGKTLLWWLVLPFLPALGTSWSLWLYGDSWSGYAVGDLVWIFFSRSYALAALGIFVSTMVNWDEVLLEMRDLGLSGNIVYGLMAVLHAIPILLDEIKEIKQASLYRQKRLSSFSPLLYAKLLIVALDWRDHYVTTMYAHAYDEENRPIRYESWHASYRGIMLGVILFFSLQITFFL